MRIDIVTIFPDYCAPLRQSLIGAAIDGGLIDLAIHDLRAWAIGRHRTVDDSPYGGGPGMVMRPDVWGRALDAVMGDATSPASHDDDRGREPVLVFPTPSGEPFTQAIATELAGAPQLVFACGRYEGIDARVVQDAATRGTVRELSIGDYVLAGGEAATLVIVEAVGRLIPGVLGNEESAPDDSFTAHHGLLEGPAYTRPEAYRGLTVPEVLLSGHHGRVARYRRDEALRRTATMRPDLLTQLSADDCDERDFEVLTELRAPVPTGLADKVAALREARESRRRWSGRP